MTKAEIANVIRDFTLDLEQQMGLNTTKVIAEMRAFAERVENDDKQPDAPMFSDTTQGQYPPKKLPEAGTYIHGEER